MNPKVERAIAKKKFDPLKKLADGRDEALRNEAIEAMGQVPGEDSFNFLTAALRSPSAAIRAAAANGLAALREPKANAFLSHQLHLETDEGVCEKIRNAMALSRK